MLLSYTITTKLLKSFPNFMITFASGSFSTEKTQSRSYYIHKPIFSFLMQNKKQKALCKEGSQTIISQQYSSEVDS